MNRNDPSSTRRAAMRALVAGAAIPAMAAARPTVGIIGGGMAGVAAAWLLDGMLDVTLLESEAVLGGNVETLEIDIGGKHYSVDMGAQYFHPGPYPTYVKLLTYLGLYPPSTGESHSFPASITVDEASEATPRFVSPIIPGRLWPILASWNADGLKAFFTGFEAAKAREKAGGSWFLSLEAWLPTLGLSQAQWEGMLLPWAASLFSGSIDDARRLSARAAMIFAAKALSDNPAQQLVYYALNRGMIEALRRMAAQFSTVQILTKARVWQVQRDPSVGFRVRTSDGRELAFDQLIFACSGPSTLTLLQGVAGAEQHRAALTGIEFHDASLALHTDPIYASSNSAYWSFFNCRIHGGFAEASMYLAPVLAINGNAGPGLWKSWTTHRTQKPAQILHQAGFRHMLPSVGTVVAQTALAGLQGRNGIWIAGGYTLPYDAQETTALLSAAAAAKGLGAGASRLATLGL